MVVNNTGEWESVLIHTKTVRNVDDSQIENQSSNSKLMSINIQLNEPIENWAINWQLANRRKTGQ